MLEALETWGDAGQNDIAPIDVKVLSLGPDQVLVAFFPKNFSQLHKERLMGHFGMLRKAMGWKGEIILLPEEMRLMILEDREAKELRQKVIDTIAGFGVTVKVAAENFETVRKMMVKTGASIAHLLDCRKSNATL